ncbi:MAG: helix-turn-helix domain-containing protein [Fibromonadaceae bacterium]|jgi:hypothetical protein|nr:helix-turn-helix domain-containing protein [Fibromonadaceae bacterium]
MRKKTTKKPEATGIRTEKKIAGKTYWTIIRAAEFLGVAQNTVRNYTKDGLSFLKMGSNFYFQEQWLTEFINEKTKIQSYRGPNGK